MYLVFPLAIDSSTWVGFCGRGQKRFLSLCANIVCGRVVSLSIMSNLLRLVLLFTLLLRLEAISFSLEPDSRKCLREEVHKDVLVVGEYELEQSHSQRTDVEVRVCVCTWEGSMSYIASFTY